MNMMTSEPISSSTLPVMIGQGLWSPWYAGGSLEDLDGEFGRERVLDSPVSENAVTGMAVGAALAGMRPIVFHPRMDFMLLAMDPVINQAANWSYLFAGRGSVPVVIRAVMARIGDGHVCGPCVAGPQQTSTSGSGRPSASAAPAAPAVISPAIQRAGRAWTKAR